MKIRAHETFSIRKGWLHKGVKNILQDPTLFTNKEGDPCKTLGIGTNMVKSLRYWMTAVGIMEEKIDGGKKVQVLTKLGNLIDKYDRYYEEDGTNWILHYQLASNEDLATSWYYFFNHTNVVDKDLFVENLSEFITIRYNTTCSKKTIEDDFDCILKTYYAKEKDVDPEETSGCPLTSLNLIIKNDKEGFKKAVPEKDAIHPLIVLAVIALINEQTEINITDLIGQDKGVYKIFNLDKSTLFYILERLQKMGYLEISRTAGLDVIRLKEKYDYYDLIERYYLSINGEL